MHKLGTEWHLLPPFSILMIFLSLILMLQD